MPADEPTLKPQTFLNALKAQIANAFNGVKGNPPYSPAGDASVRLSSVRHFDIPLPNPPPEGYVYIEEGMMKRTDKLTGYERERESLLQPLAQQWIEAWLNLADIAARFNDAFDQIEELNQPRNSLRVKAGKKPSLTVFLLDRSMSLSRRRSDTVRFQEDILLSAKSLVDGCVERWAAGGDDKIRQLAELSFTKNAQGEYSRSGMVKLRRLDTDDPQWKAAMDKIDDAEIVDGVSSYLLVSVRDIDGKYHPLPLDIAGIRPYRVVPAA